MKITTSTDKIRSFGGLNFISKQFDDLNIEDLITQYLGKRPTQAVFSYSDIIKNLWSITFAGGDCAEDIHSNLKEELLAVSNLKICSPDTILNVQKSLANEKEIHLSKTKTVNEFSKHAVLNALNVDFLIQARTLIPHRLYDFDFDNQFLANEKYDSRKGYKMKEGYFPGVATIGNFIVYIENRNGNSNVKFKQNETLKAAYDLLKSKNILIDRSRMDCGSFTKEIVTVAVANSKRVAQRCDELYRQLQAVKIGKK